MWFDFALTLTYKDFQAACHTKSKKMWWRFEVVQADDIDGVGIVISPWSTKVYSRKYIDSTLNILSTHQDYEITDEHLLCERFQKYTLILHQVIASIPTGRGQNFLEASLWWYSTPSDLIAKLHYQDFYRGWLQEGDIVFFDILWGWDLGDGNRVHHTDSQGGPHHAHSLA